MFKERGIPAALLVESSASASQVPSAVSNVSQPSGRTGAPKLCVAMVGCDPVNASALRHMLMQTGRVKEVLEWGSTKSAEVRSAQDVPDIVFLDLSGDNEADFTFSQTLCKFRPTVNIAVCSANKQTNPEFLLLAMRAGVREFLEKPFDRIDVSSLLARVDAEHGSEVTPRRSMAGKLFAVLGTKGGVGTSTVAVNIAVQLARTPDKSAVLLDFSRPMGDVAALLDLRPRFQFKDAVENFARLDATLLGGLTARHSSGLHVLCGATNLEDWRAESSAAIERIVEVAQQSFDFVVMDLGSFYSAEWQNIMQASEVLLVSEADLPGLAKLHRHLRALSNLRVSSAQVRLVINRWHRHDEPALEKVENDMRTPVFARLPNNFKQVTDATLRGNTVEKGSDSLSTGFQEMAGRLAGIKQAKEPKKSRLGQFLSL